MNQTQHMIKPPLIISKTLKHSQQHHMRPPSKQLSSNEYQSLVEAALGNEIEVWEVDEGGHFVGCAGGASLNKHESKHHLAMLRLGVEGRTKAHEVLWAIEDLIGP